MIVLPTLLPDDSRSRVDVKKVAYVAKVCNGVSVCSCRI